jgi:hypothetical protein
MQTGIFTQVIFAAQADACEHTTPSERSSSPPARDDGGWQEATATLEFREHIGLSSSYSYSCTMKVGMPLRAKVPGRIQGRPLMLASR